MNFADAKNHLIRFGKHNGKTLDQVAETSSGLRYLDWLRGEMEPKAKDPHIRFGSTEQATYDALCAYLDDAAIAADVAALAKEYR